VLKAKQPLTLAAVSVAEAWTPRARLMVGGDRQGDREERRTVEASTQVVSDLAQLETVDPQDGEAGTIADWPALGQVCRSRREVEDVSGRRAGDGHEPWASALTSLAPEQADPARLERLWRGHGQIENGWHEVRDVTLGDVTLGDVTLGDVTLGEDACQVRSGQAPANLAACRNAVLNLLRQAGLTHIAAALRRNAMYPREALAFLGIRLA
jgi:hypothetical protein